MTPARWTAAAIVAAALAGAIGFGLRAVIGGVDAAAADSAAYTAGRYVGYIVAGAIFCGALAAVAAALAWGVAALWRRGRP